MGSAPEKRKLRASDGSWERMYFVPSETVEEQWKEIKEANLTNLAGDFWPVSNTPCVTERERERRRRRAGVGRAVASPAFPRREASAALPPPLVRTPSRRRDQAKYQNEAEVGDALEEAFETGLVKRGDLFITTKLWNSDHGHVIEACKDSLQKLKLDYLDLYLVHFPVATRHTEVGSLASVIGEDGVLDIDTTVSLEATWHAMEDLVNMGLVRSIGISNYGVFLTRDCLAYAKIKPAVNQIEMHPYFQRDSLVKFCQKHGICVTAHTPLGGSTANTKLFGSVSCLDDPVIKELAEKYGKTPAQLVLRWGLQKNTVVIPKTSKVERLQENLDVFDLDISDEDMEEIKAIDRNHRTNQPAKFWGIDVYS